MITGASVWLLVDRQTVGKLLHVLEYFPDIHIIKQQVTAAGTMQKWLLRSDQFPHAWNWKHVQGSIELNPPNISFSILRAKKKGAVTQWQPKPKKS